MSIFLARQLSYADFGELAISLAILSFFIQLYTSFSLEPMSILGPSNYQDHLSSYLLAQVKLLFFLSIPTCILLSFMIWLGQFTGRPIIAETVLISLAVGIPFMLFPFLMRRIFYVLSKPGIALIGSLIYSLSLLFIFYLVGRFELLNAVNSIMIISVASFLSGLTILLCLRDDPTLSTKLNLLAILGEMWSFGKWLIVAGICIGLATQIQVYLAGSLSGVENAGAVRILQIFIQPMMLTSTALSALVTPLIAADFATKAYRSMQGKIYQFTLILGGIALFYELFLMFFSASLNQLLFEGKYSSITAQIPIWGLVPILLSFFWGGALALQAIRRPQAMVIISGFWLFFSLVPCFLLIPHWGTWGATISIVTGFFAAFVSTWILYWQWVHRIYMNEKK